MIMNDLMPSRFSVFSRVSLFALLIVLFCVSGISVSFAQTNTRIMEIEVTSNRDGDSAKGLESMVKSQCGLSVGSLLSRDAASEAVKTIWQHQLFDNVTVSQESVEGGVKVIIHVEVRPQVNSITTTGFEEIKEEEALQAIKLSKYLFISESRIVQMRQALLDMYKEKGFLRAEVSFELKPLESDSTRVDVTVTVNEGKKIKIKKISIEGNQNISDRKLKKKMSTKEHRWYRSGEFKEEDFESDKELIVAMYKMEGYRDAVVLRDSVHFDDKDDMVNLTLFVSEGQKYKFGSSSIEGNVRFTEEELRAHMKYAEGDFFNEMLVQMAMVDIMTAYNNQGYLQAQVNPVQIAHGDTVDIKYEIAEFFVAKIAKVIVEGNTKTHEKVIRREIELLPGESFNREKLERSYREIMALNFFDPSGVNFEYDPPDEENNVNIRFKVKERSTGIAQVGAGYSERDRLVGTLGFQNSNLFGRGQSVSVNIDQGSRRKAFQTYFTEPWLLDTPTIFTFSLYHIIRSDYTTAFDQETRRGGYVRLGRELKWPDYSRAYITYRLEDIDYANPSEYYSYYLVTGKTSSVSLAFKRDSTDMPQFATKGSKSAAIVEVAGGPLGGDLSYYKYLMMNEVYYPLFWKLSFVVRSRMGYLKGYREDRFVPYSERFMPGGTSYDGIVRGYSNRQVCPRISGEEIGGETMFVNNLELQVPIVANTVAGILFYDFGNSWRDLSETNPFDLKRSAGVGVRLFVPNMGLLGFDFAYGFDKLEGASKVGGWRTHFQFGNFNDLFMYY